MKTLISILSAFVLACVTSLNAATPDTGQNVFDYWTQQNINEITLRFDLDELEQNRMTEASFKGELTAGEQTYGVKMEVRGRFRRRTCALPPMKLHLDKEGLRHFGFNTNNDFKLVTHCTDDAAGREALVKEELAYELYRLVNPTASFRTRLVTVNYIDAKDGATTTSYAIIIEDTSELESRLGAKSQSDRYGLNASEINNETEVALFQYMIGNTDYGFVMQRNLKLMQGADGRYTAVPYDFDFSGLVNASYATPSSYLGQHKMTDRVLIWEFEQAPANLASVSADFLAQKETVLNTVANFPSLSDDSKKEITKYLKGFYRELNAGTIGAAVAK